MDNQKHPPSQPPRRFDNSFSTPIYGDEMNPEDMNIKRKNPNEDALDNRPTKIEKFEPMNYNLPQIYPSAMPTGVHSHHFIYNSEHPHNNNNNNHNNNNNNPNLNLNPNHLAQGDSGEIPVYKGDPTNPKLAKSMSTKSQKKKKATSEKELTQEDDLLILHVAQSIEDFDNIQKHFRFSSKFPKEQLERRWRDLLYNDEEAKAILPVVLRNMQGGAIKRAAYSGKEDQVLKEEYVLAEARKWEEILLKRRAEFHPGRSARSLENRWNRLKKESKISTFESATSPKSTFPAPERKDFPDFESIEDNLDPKHPPSLDVSRNVTHEQIRQHDDSQQKKMLDLESKIHQGKLLEPQSTLALIRGKNIRYCMKTKEITLGRQVENSPIDIDLTLDCPDPAAALKISRNQAHIKLKKDGEFYIKNRGRKLIYVNGVPIEREKRCLLLDQSLVEIGDVRFIFEP